MHNYISVIGAANIDIGGTPYHPLIRSDSNPGKINISYGGVGRNIAQNLVNLGLKTNLFTTIGDDFFGREMISYCNKKGINTEFIKIKENEPSSIYMFINNEKGDMEIALSHMNADQSITADYIDSFSDVINHSEIVVVDCNISADLLTHIIDICKVPIYVDTVSANKSVILKNNLKGIDTIKPNKIEAELITGITINKDEDYLKAADYMIHQGIRRVFISMGKEGVMSADSHNAFIVNGYETEAVSTTGAGDSAMAAIVWASTFLKEKIINKNNHYNDLLVPSFAANAAASITVESEDTISDLLSPTTLMKKMNSQKINVRKLR